jgi:hypothetical protein
MVSMGGGKDGPSRIRTRVRRKKVDRDAMVAEVMKPFESKAVNNGENVSISQPGRDVKVTTRMLLDAISNVQKSQMEFQGMVTQSLKTLAEKVAAGGVEADIDDDDANVEDFLASPLLGGRGMADGRSSPDILESESPRAPGSRGSKVLKAHEDAMAISIQKMAKKMFEMLDTDEGNEIAIEDAVDFVRKSGNSKNTPTNESIAAIYDTDGNGMIDLSEFTVIVSDIYKSKTTEARVTNQAIGGMSDVFSFLSDVEVEEEEESVSSLLLPIHRPTDCSTNFTQNKPHKQTCARSFSHTRKR